MNLLNQFSYLLIAGGTVALCALFLRHVLRARGGVTIALSGVIITGFVAGFALLQTGEGDVTDFEGAQALIANDRPTFIEFFSNYCTGCLLLRPMVDQIISDIDDEYNILRINIHSEAGRELRQQYQFSFTPEFVLLTADGREVWRDHLPPDESALNLARNTSG